MSVARSSFGSTRGEVREKTKNFNLIHLLFFLAVVLSCKGCPEKCECSSQTVKCQNKDLHAIPQPLPANTQFLFITGNNISRIGRDSFPSRLEHLTYLNLTGNELESVDSAVFYNLPNMSVLDMSNNKIESFSTKAFPDDNKLQDLTLSRAFHNLSSMDVVLSVLWNGSLLRLTHLDLSNNELVVLPDGMFAGLLKLTHLNLRNGSIISLPNGTLRVPPLRDLDLRDNGLRELPNDTLAELGVKPGLQIRMAGNPWRCDCFMEDLVVWLKSSWPGEVTDKHNLTCADPEDLRRLPLLQVDQDQLVCTYSGDMKGVLETSYVLLGMVLALIGLIFLLVLYLNRKGIKRWMYNIRDACRDHMEGYHYRYEINSDPRLANLSINSDV